jgi:hypothetical protein
MPALPHNVSVLLLALLLNGCGGRVDGERDPEPGAGSSTGSGSNAGTGSASGDDRDWSSPLSECVPGFALAEAGQRSCNWTANGKCFEMRDDACGCECRRTGGGVCSSGFPEPNAGVEVSCF